MARRSTIEEIRQLEPGETIMLVRATLTKIFKPTSGTNSYGDYTLQKGEIKDETGTMPVMFNDREHPVPDSWKGEELIFESVKTQHGYKGMTAHDDTYVPKKPNAKAAGRTLKVSKVAEVGLASESGGGTQEEEAPAPARSAPAPARGGQTQAAPAKQAPAPQQQQPPAPRQERPAPEAQPQQPPADPAPAADPTKVIKRNMFRDALFMALAIKATKEAILPAVVDACQGCSEESIQKYATTLFLEGCRRGDNKLMPTPKKAHADPAPEPEPEPEPTPVMTTKHPLAPERKPYRDPLEDADDIPF